MSKSQSKAIENAKRLKKQFGGTIFAFPIEEENPFSPYSIVVFHQGMYFPFPDATDLSEAALGVNTLLEEMRKNGMDDDYERNVRLILHQAQKDAPSTVMRRLKKKHLI